MCHLLDKLTSPYLSANIKISTGGVLFKYLPPPSYQFYFRQRAGRMNFMASFEISGKKKTKVEKYALQELRIKASAIPIRKKKKIKGWKIVVRWYTTPPARENITIKEIKPRCTNLGFEKKQSPVQPH